MRHNPPKGAASSSYPVFVTSPVRTLCCLLLASPLLAQTAAPPASPPPISASEPATVFGFRSFAQQSKWEAGFLAVPDPAHAGEDMKILSAVPHWASSPGDYATAEYVARQFKAAGLETSITPYRVLLNTPKKILIEAFDTTGKRLMSGPAPEHVDASAFGGDPQQDDPRVLPAFNGSSPSADVTAEAVYANYGTAADFKRLASLGISVEGKIVLVRYGSNFRGVKSYLAQKYGAAGVLIYSDPADDGYAAGDVYPKGPWRPASAVQRGSVQQLPIYPGDPETPGISSTPDLPDSARLTDRSRINQPSIPVNPLSYADAAPILQALAGPSVPREWQGALPFTYHLGGSPAVTVHMLLQQDYERRTIWDVLGVIPGSDPAQQADWVIAGNHRDAWVYGAADPLSGTVALLETARGLGALLKQGWHPKRRVVLASWDAEEEGLIGSTEWVEQHIESLSRAVAYFNTDVAVSGPGFNAAATPSLKEFVREITRVVPSAAPGGNTVYDIWQHSENHPATPASSHHPPGAAEAYVGTLGSGSDYTPFFQHAGIPSTDIESDGPYGVYHSVFDDYAWFLRFADPSFTFEQQQARVLGLEVLRMADADVLPYDYRTYGHEVSSLLTLAREKASSLDLHLDFSAANAAAARFTAAGDTVYNRQLAASGNLPALNTALRAAEQAFLTPEGLPRRPWYKHLLFAPGEFTGYAAVPLPGVNEAIDDTYNPPDPLRAQAQLDQLAAALNRAATVLEAAR
jgi:N-acetylated-alpha-linked acidic dipeptidase